MMNDIDNPGPVSEGVNSRNKHQLLMMLAVSAGFAVACLILAFLIGPSWSAKPEPGAVDAVDVVETIPDLGHE